VGVLTAGAGGWLAGGALGGVAWLGAGAGAGAGVGAGVGAEARAGADGETGTAAGPGVTAGRLAATGAGRTRKRTVALTAEVLSAGRSWATNRCPPGERCRRVRARPPAAFGWPPSRMNWTRPVPVNRTRASTVDPTDAPGLGLTMAIPAGVTGAGAVAAGAAAAAGVAGLAGAGLGWEDPQPAIRAAIAPAVTGSPTGVISRILERRVMAVRGQRRRVGIDPSRRALSGRSAQVRPAGLRGWRGWRGATRRCRRGDRGSCRQARS
jgi:hypothetical protein